MSKPPSKADLEQSDSDSDSDIPQKSKVPLVSGDGENSDDGNDSDTSFKTCESKSIHLSQRSDTSGESSFHSCKSTADWLTSEDWYVKHTDEKDDIETQKPGKTSPSRPPTKDAMMFKDEDDDDEDSDSTLEGDADDDLDLTPTPSISDMNPSPQ